MSIILDTDSAEHWLTTALKPHTDAAGELPGFSERWIPGANGQHALVKELVHGAHRIGALVSTNGDTFRLVLDDRGAAHWWAVALTAPFEQVGVEMPCVMRPVFTEQGLAHIDSKWVT